MQQLSSIYQITLPYVITTLFCATIIGWLVYAVKLLFRPSAQRHVSARFVAITPTCLASLGVLGTFTGILIGLLDFDVNRVDNSVPALLAGLKIAFTTSIVGIAAAIIFRFVRTVAPNEHDFEGVTSEDFYAVLVMIRADGRAASDGLDAQLGELRRTISSKQESLHAVLVEIRDDGRVASNRTVTQLGELRRAISSEGDSSLLTQVQKLRTTLQDTHSELIREFRDFAQHMTENNQKVIIEALEQVIRDFNRNLIEQFGENFKQLNAAVHTLVAWQDKYREHVEELEERLEMAVNAIEASQRALASVQNHSERIPEAIKLLEPVLNGINTQTEAMGAHLEAIAALRAQAIEAFPVIEANLKKITTQFAASVEDTVAQSRQALAEGEKAQKELGKSYAAFLKGAGESREHFAAELANALKQMSEQSVQEFARHGQLVDAVIKEVQKAINESWGRSVEKMNGQFVTFDQEMQQELTRALERLGRDLASVSEKFVKDYTPLTERLRELINISKEGR